MTLFNKREEMNISNEKLGLPIYVIIPVYNCKKYLECAINSVLSQSIKINIILIDDGSNDGSSFLCDIYQKKYENIFTIHQSNKGVSSARNKGMEYILKKEKNGYIAFLDADDCWIDNFFNENVKNILKSNYDLICFEHYESDEELKNCNLIKNKNMGEMKNENLSTIWAHEKRHLGSMFFSIEFLKKFKIHFLNGLKYNEDEIFKVYAECLCKKIYFIKQANYIYRIHQNSSVHNLDKNILERYKTWMNAWKLLDVNLKKKYNIVTDFGTRFAESYFIEMCIVYTQALQPSNVLKKVIRLHTESEDFKKYDMHDYPAYLQKDYEYIKNNNNIFFIKHKIIGYLRLIKSIVSGG